MKKSDLIKTLAQRTGYSQGVVRNVYNALILLIFQTVSEKTKILVSGLGRFHIKYTPSRIMHSVATRQPCQTKGSRSPKFRASQYFKNAVLEPGQRVAFVPGDAFQDTLNFKRLHEEGKYWLK